MLSRYVALRHEAALNKLVQSALAKLINERLPVDIRRGILLLRTIEIVVGGLTQIAEIFAKDRILDLDIRQD
jgi:hypothetical protein